MCLDKRMFFRQGSNPPFLLVTALQITWLISLRTAWSLLRASGIARVFEIASQHLIPRLLGVTHARRGIGVLFMRRFVRMSEDPIRRTATGSFSMELGYPSRRALLTGQ